MSWSDNRSNDSSNQRNWEERKVRLEHVNAVLGKISQDEDFYDDLKIPMVQRALDHWTGKNRLPPDEAVQLQDNRRCVYVLQRIQMLQTVCQQAGIAVPLDLLLQKKFLDIDSSKPKHVEKILKDEKVEAKGEKSTKSKAKSLEGEEKSQSKAVNENVIVSGGAASKENKQLDSISSTEPKVTSVESRPNSTLLIGLFFLLLYFILSRFIEN